MIQRCENTKSRNYPKYGARGITVCQRWRGEQGFQAFMADMGPRPSANHSIDRKDNNGNYEPGNCSWATRVQQARNKRTSVVLTVEGQSGTVAEWAERMGIGRSTIKERLRRGWSPERALSKTATS
jgi:hypothetical protein